MPTYNEYLKKLNHKRNFVDQHAIDFKKLKDSIPNKISFNSKLNKDVQHDFDNIIEVCNRLKDNFSNDQIIRERSKWEEEETLRKEKEAREKDILLKQRRKEEEERRQKEYIQNQRRKEEERRQKEYIQNMRRKEEERKKRNWKMIISAIKIFFFFSALSFLLYLLF